ncbi:MAG: hypothetical protein LBU55_01010 [Elusimicrobiota bacterium]|jgi:hypothetical protein|nr:hypothetical protein [Elusimicrobiota bacterium]
MLKTFTLLLSLFAFAVAAFAQTYQEGSDYTVSFTEKPAGYACVLHINFSNTTTTSHEKVLEALKHQLTIYGNKFVHNSKMKNANIIGSAWYFNETTGENTKIKFQDDLGSYVWFSREKRVIPFPTYIALLKKSKKTKLAKEKRNKRINKALKQQQSATKST